MPKQKEDLRVLRTRKLLYSTLITLLQKQSIEDLSVVGICDMAMVHRTTFYAYFEDKYHLLTCLVEEIKHNELEKLDKNMNELNLKDFCRAAALTILNYIAEHEDIIRKIFENNNNEKVMSVIRTSLERSIKDMVHAENKQIGYKLPVYIISTFFTGGIYNVFYFWLSNPEIHVTRIKWMEYIDIILNDDLYTQIN
ncbi:MAG: TetR/AcrR family transcriptional regulator [Clostridia bacterium]